MLRSAAKDALRPKGGITAVRNAELKGRRCLAVIFERFVMPFCILSSHSIQTGPESNCFQH